MFKFKCIGAIIGDYIGSRFEFNNHKSKGFSLIHPDCRFTDDTFMTIAVMATIHYAKENNFLDDEEKYKSMLIKCFKHYFKRFPDGAYGGMFCHWCRSDSTEPYNSFGNGACMRVSPCAYVSDDLETCLKIADWTTEVTHNHPQAMIWVGRYITVIWNILHTDFTVDGKKEQIKEIFKALHVHIPSLDEIRKKECLFDETCDGTLPVAIACVLESENFEDTIRNAVSVGGDTDTICAIAGGIAEPLFCFRTLPCSQDIINKLHIILYNMVSAFNLDFLMSENTKKILALVEGEDYLELVKYDMVDVYTPMNIIYSARADVRYKLELLNGMIAEFKGGYFWDNYERGKKFMEEYEPFRKAVEGMKPAENVHFTLMKVTRLEDGTRSYYNDYPEFSSVEEISRYLESHFDEKQDSEYDPEWYIANSYEVDEKPLYVYLLSKRGTVWKCSRDSYCYIDSAILGFVDKSDIFVNDEIESIGWEIDGARFMVGNGDIFVCDRRPFYDVCHMLYITFEGECPCGIYVEDGIIKDCDLECHFPKFEDFAIELRAYVQEDMSKLSEQENILFKIQQKYRLLNEKDGWEFMQNIYYLIGLTVEEAEKEFLK